MNEWEKEIDDISRKEPNEAYIEILKYLKGFYQKYLDSKATDVEVSDMTVYCFSTRDDFSDAMSDIDERFRDLRAAMDITHPDFSKEKRRKIINGLIELSESLLEDHSK